MAQPASVPRMAVRSADTTGDIEQRQADQWRWLSPVERLRLVSGTTRAVMDLSLAGIRRRHPQASERECFLRQAAFLLSADTTRQLYAEHLTTSVGRGERPGGGRAQRGAAIDPRRTHRLRADDVGCAPEAEALRSSQRHQGRLNPGG